MPLTEKTIIKRAEVLRNALDHGILNIPELRSFLVTVERFSPPAKRTARRDMRQRYMEMLSQGTRAKARV